MDPLLEAEVDAVKFPRLRSSETRKTSDRTPKYNCIAWTVGDTRRWWQPGLGKAAFWPANVPGKWEVPSFVALFAKHGFVPCEGGSFEVGYDKIVLFTADGEPTHGSRQVGDGKWTSKLGKGPDIEHGLNDLDGPSYGAPTHFFRRKTAQPAPGANAAAP